MSSASSPRRSERDVKRGLIDDSYVIPLDVAAQLLGFSEKGMRRMVEYSRLNAKHNIEGPLRVEGKQGVTLRSVLAYRRQTAPSRTT